MSRPWCSAIAHGIRLAVQISPNAKRTEIAGEAESALKIRLKAQPVDGKANEALIRFLADTLGVPKSAVSITHGFAGKKKLLEVRSGKLTVAEVEKFLKP